MNRIAELRKQKGLSQKEFAKFLKISPGNLCEWEKGRIEPSVDSLNIIANYFDVSIDYLVGRTDDFGNIKKSDVEIDKTTQELLKILSTFNERQKERVLAYAEGVLESEKEYRRRIK